MKLMQCVLRRNFGVGAEKKNPRYIANLFTFKSNICRNLAYNKDVSVRRELIEFFALVN